MLTAAICSAVLLMVAVTTVLIMHKPSQSAPETVHMRACPVCNKELKMGENILAERTGVTKEGRERIIIKGCVHCMKRI